MPVIIETLADRKGNIIPNTVVKAREAGNPGGAISSATSDQNGLYEMTVSESGTIYDIWVIEVTSVESSNYIGRSVSSGDIVSSFTLCSDPDWADEHHTGATLACGLHKSTTHDDITIRTGGFLKHDDAIFPIRVGSDTAILNIEDIGDTFFLDPSTGTNSHLGLKAGSFYFGTPKLRYINSTGDFDLNGGTFQAAVTFANTATFNGKATFPNTPGAGGNYPQISPIYVAPTQTFELAPKKYVDDEIAVLAAFNDIIFENNTEVETIDDGVSAGQVVTRIGKVAAKTAVGVVTERNGLPDNYGFSFGGIFAPDQLMHLRLSGQQVAIKLERQGSGNSTVVVDETGIGTTTGTSFILRSGGANAGAIDNSQNFGFGLISSITERGHFAGNIRLQNYIHFDTKAVPSDPSNANHARMYLRENASDPANNEIAVKIKKAGVITEVLITSPKGFCEKCGKDQDARDPYFDLKNGKMRIDFYCGHSYEIGINSNPISR